MSTPKNQADLTPIEEAILENLEYKYKREFRIAEPQFHVGKIFGGLITGIQYFEPEHNWWTFCEWSREHGYTLKGEL